MSWIDSWDEKTACSAKDGARGAIWMRANMGLVGDEARAVRLIHTDVYVHCESDRSIESEAVVSFNSCFPTNGTNFEKAWDHVLNERELCIANGRLTTGNSTGSPHSLPVVHTHGAHHDPPTPFSSRVNLRRTLRDQ